MVQKKATLKFEDAIKQLESLVQDLEQGDLDLDCALEKFEQGIKLIRTSQAKLDQAQQKVSMLMQESDTLLPFENKDNE